MDSQGGVRKLVVLGVYGDCTLLPDPDYWPSLDEETSLVVQG